jgi:mono/diheme cytochrome c family protein
MRTKLLIFCVAIAASVGCGDKDKNDEPDQSATAAIDPAKTPDPAEPAKVDPALIERGSYIAKVTGCVGCHTAIGPKGPDMANAFAGGLEMKEPFGIWRSPNITPHVETGIGGWTDEQIIDSIREGKRPDGSQIAAIMPYMGYNRMSDDDAKALVAFLRTLKPIERKVAASELKLPPIPAPPASGEAPDQSDPVTYGEYLVSLMHCDVCHTPMDEKTFAPLMDKRLAGGMHFELPPPLGEGVMYASNITPDDKTGIGGWTEEQIAAAVKGMKRPDNTPIGFPMMTYAAVWSQLTDQDALAIAKYLKSIPAVANQVPASTGKLTMGGPPPQDGPPAKKAPN